MDERKLFTNQFIDTNVYNVRSNPDQYLKEQSEFKDFINRKNPEFGNINFTTSAKERSTLVDRSETISDMIEERKQLLDQVDTNKINNKNVVNIDSTIDDKYINFREFETRNNNNYIQLRKRYLAINSSDRNTSLYPFPNNYKVSLDKEIFSNIISIKIKSAEFKNTEQTIYKTPLDETNNKIYFGLYEDNYTNYVSYIATLEHGTYTYEGLSKELERVMNYEIQKEGTHKNYKVYVSIDSDLNYVVFNAYKWTNAPHALRFFGTTGTPSSTLNVVYPSHGITVADTFTLRNVSDIELPTFVTAVADDIFNTLYTVSAYIDSDTIQVTNTNSATETSYTPGVTNGYIYENTGGGAIEAGIALNMEIYFNSASKLATLLGFPSATVRSQDIGTTVDYTTTPDEADIISDITYDKSVTNNVYTKGIPLNYVLPYNGGKSTLINTYTNHGLTTGDRISIPEGPQTLTTFPSSGGTGSYTVQDFFYLYLDGALTLPTAKDTTNSALRDLFTDNLKNTNGYLIDVIDETNFTINLEFIDYEIDDPDNPGEYITMSAYTTREIVDATGVTRGSVVLNSRSTLDVDGEEVIYMLSETIGGNFATSNETDLLENSYAQIQLAGDPGDTIYNSYIGGQKIYYDTPLNSLTELDFQFRDKNGTFYDFKNIDHSFTLEILEIVQKVEGTDYNARLGNQISTKN
jgi:hypothetical protein